MPLVAGSKPAGTLWSSLVHNRAEVTACAALLCRTHPPIHTPIACPVAQTSATAFNEGSSRSHTIIRITIEASGALPPSAMSLPSAAAAVVPAACCAAPAAAAVTGSWALAPRWCSQQAPGQLTGHSGRHWQAF